MLSTIWPNASKMDFLTSGHTSAQFSFRKRFVLSPSALSPLYRLSSLKWIFEIASDSLMFDGSKYSLSFLVTNRPVNLIVASGLPANRINGGDYVGLFALPDRSAYWLKCCCLRHLGSARWECFRWFCISRQFSAAALLVAIHICRRFSLGIRYRGEYSKLYITISHENASALTIFCRNETSRIRWESCWGSLVRHSRDFRRLVWWKSLEWSADRSELDWSLCDLKARKMTFE